MIVTDKNKLTSKCEITSLKEGEEISVRLLHELRQTSGIGLAANQVERCRMDYLNKQPTQQTDQELHRYRLC